MKFLKYFGSWIFALGFMMWALTLVIGIIVDVKWFWMNWRWISELVWLVLGCLYVWIAWKRVIKLELKFVIGEVLLFLFGILLVWMVVIMITSGLIGDMGSVAVAINETTGNLVRMDDGWVNWRGLMGILVQSMRLWIVAVIPSVVVKVGIKLGVI